MIAAAPKVVKMQTSWPASDIWMDFARQYVVRVERMAGDRSKIDLLPAGAVVQAVQFMDAGNDGVLEAAHTVPVYWYDKHRAASLFGTGPVFGGSATTMLAWFNMSSYHQASESFELLFNKDFVDDLDEDLRAILQYGVEAASTSNTATRHVTDGPPSSPACSRSSP